MIPAIFMACCKEPPANPLHLAPRGPIIGACGGFMRKALLTLLFLFLPLGAAPVLLAESGRQAVTTKFITAAPSEGLAPLAAALKAEGYICSLRGTGLLLTCQAPAPSVTRLALRLSPETPDHPRPRRLRAAVTSEWYHWALGPAPLPPSHQTESARLLHRLRQGA